MYRLIITLSAFFIASSESGAKEQANPSIAEQLNQYSAQAVIARSTKPEIFRRIVYKSTGRKLLTPRLSSIEQITVPSIARGKKVPLEGFVLRKTPDPVFAPKPNPPGLSNSILTRVQTYDTLIKTYSNINGLDPNLVRAVIYVESAGDKNIVSSEGAEGLMQLMPGTASDIGVSNSFDPAQNIYGGTRYLGSLLKRFKRIDLALWGYNAGPESVKRKRLPLETKLYSPNVLRIKAILDEEGV
ncbi:MAG: lytic transglycosylase domain-containing protein [Candidatus Latescibacterota bacterium]|nr:lytic transglycosylase domain-containing protein [Candidatus Latescibacterota bacterium]